MTMGTCAGSNKRFMLDAGSTSVVLGNVPGKRAKYASGVGQTINQTCGPSSPFGHGHSEGPDEAYLQMSIGGATPVTGPRRTLTSFLSLFALFAGGKG